MDGHSSGPQIATSGSNVYVVWEKSDIDQTQLSFRTSNNNGASFGNAKIIPTPVVETRIPLIAASGSNVYIAGWEGSEDRTQIFFMRRSQ